MELRDYLKSVDDLEGFAVRCETTVGQLRQVAGKHRKAGESLCINIERESSGVIKCESLRPDVDWNFLRSTKPAKNRAVA